MGEMEHGNVNVVILLGLPSCSRKPRVLMRWETPLVPVFRVGDLLPSGTVTFFDLFPLPDPGDLLPLLLFGDFVAIGGHDGAIVLEGASLLSVGERVGINPAAVGSMLADVGSMVGP